MFFSLLIPILRRWYSNTVENICYTRNYWIQVLLIKIKHHYTQLINDTDLINQAMFLIGKGILNDRVSVPSSFRKVESYYPQSIENTYQAITKLSAQLPFSNNKYQHLLILEYVYFFALNYQKQFSFYQVKTQPVDNLNEHVILLRLIASIACQLRQTDYPGAIFSNIPDRIIQDISISPEKKIHFKGYQDRVVIQLSGEQQADLDTTLVSKEGLEFLIAYLLMTGNKSFARYLYLHKNDEKNKG
jgi:hypothetical protein